MLHRKLRETKQQPSMVPGPAVPGCCLVSLRSLCNIHSIHSVDRKLTLSVRTLRFKWVKMPRWNYNISLYFFQLPTFSLNDLICILTKERRGKRGNGDRAEERRRAPSGPIPRAVHVLSLFKQYLDRWWISGLVYLVAVWNMAASLIYFNNRLC